MQFVIIQSPDATSHYRYIDAFSDLQHITEINMYRGVGNTLWLLVTHWL